MVTNKSGMKGPVTKAGGIKIIIKQMTSSLLKLRFFIIKSFI